MAGKSGQLLPLLENLLKHSDERSIEALRALTNLADSSSYLSLRDLRVNSNAEDIRKALCAGDSIHLIVKLLDQPLTKVQACWTIGNICVDGKMLLGVLENFIELLSF